MLIVLSPAKKLDFESDSVAADAGSAPRLMNDTEDLVKAARKLKASDLKAMMGVSDAIADLNVERFKSFTVPFTSANARPAMDAFKGDVYVGLDVPTMSAEDRQFTDKHVRILSGLYGLLKPLDLMQAYRLEMGTRFQSKRGTNLYQFWGDKIADLLRDDMATAGGDTLVNLASTEYFKAVKLKTLGHRVITPQFKDIKDGKSRVVSFLAKKARGEMARWAVDHRITDPLRLKDFEGGGYRFDGEASTETTWVFSRLQPPPVGSK